MDQRQEDEILKEFGNNLKNIRNAQGLSVRELAAMAEMDQSNLTEIETGKTNTRLITIHRLAEALQVDPTELISPT